MANKDRQNTWLSLQPITGVKFDDGTTQTSADVEGTSVKSTGESGGSKFLREDGDGTCSWQDTAPDGSSVKSTVGGSSVLVGYALVALGDGTSSWQATAPEGEAVKSTTNSNETSGKVLTADGDGTTSWQTNESTDTMGSGFVLEDADGTEVTITEGKVVSIQEGTGIDVNWIDTDNGTQADPYDLQISCNIEGTEVSSTTNGNEADDKFLRADGDGTCSWQEAGASVAYGETHYITAVDVKYGDSAYNGTNRSGTWEDIAANSAWEGAHTLIVQLEL